MNLYNGIERDLCVISSRGEYVELGLNRFAAVCRRAVRNFVHAFLANNLMLAGAEDDSGNVRPTFAAFRPFVDSYSDCAHEIQTLLLDRLQALDGLLLKIVGGWEGMVVAHHNRLDLGLQTANRCVVNLFPLLSHLDGEGFSLTVLVKHVQSHFQLSVGNDRNVVLLVHGNPLLILGLLEGSVGDGGELQYISVGGCAEGRGKVD